MNCGDSRCVLCRNGTCVELNVTHNTQNVNEVKRIVDAGGVIIHNRVMGVLQVTRSLGDIEYKSLKEDSWKTTFSGELVSSFPDICKEYRMPDVRLDCQHYICRTSLSLWGVMSCSMLFLHKHVSTSFVGSYLRTTI